MLATAGRLWLEPAEFRALGFPPEEEAGLGALLLPKEALADHFARWPDLPTDGRFQGYWLRGQRRLDGSAGAVEALAQRPGLKDGHRLDLWRRASEKRLLARQWEPGLADLEQALALMDSDASRGMRARLREWVVQALALAVALDRQGDADRILALADQALGPDDRATFRHDAAALLAQLGHDRPDIETGLRAEAEAMVRRGDADELGDDAGLALPDPGAWRHELWARWARWGLALTADADAVSADGSSYRAGLAAVLASDAAAQRHAAACALAGRLLRGHDLVPVLLDWSLQRDVERLSGGAALPRTSPLPDISRRLRRAGTSPAVGHALLGAALALGDDRGILGAAVQLPAAGAEDRVFRSFWYPLPSDPAVREALAAVDLPAEILLAIARNESLFEPAVRSRAGALGYMQIMPFHYADPAGPPGPDHWSHPAASLRAGARILAGEVRRFDGDPYRAVAAYNAGSGAVTRWDRQLGGSASRSVYWAWIGYPETRGYTLRVLRDREVYRQLLGTLP
jgi:soluble lytic murein transglycosylase-like protein